MTRFESGINILVDMREELWQKLSFEVSLPDPDKNQVRIQELTKLLNDIQDVIYFLTPRTAQEEAMDGLIKIEESLGLR